MEEEFNSASEGEGGPDAGWTEWFLSFVFSFCPFFVRAAGREKEISVPRFDGREGVAGGELTVGDGILGKSCRKIAAAAVIHQNRLQTKKLSLTWEQHVKYTRINQTTSERQEITETMPVRISQAYTKWAIYENPWYYV